MDKRGLTNTDDTEWGARYITHWNWGLRFLDLRSRKVGWYAFSILPNTKVVFFFDWYTLRVTFDIKTLRNRLPSWSWLTVKDVMNKKAPEVTYNSQSSNRWSETKNAKMWATIHHQKLSRMQNHNVSPSEVSLQCNISVRRFIQYVVERHMFPDFHSIQNAVFQYENARAHVVSEVIVFLEQHQGNGSSWPHDHLLLLQLNMSGM